MALQTTPSPISLVLFGPRFLNASTSSRVCYLKVFLPFWLNSTGEGTVPCPLDIWRRKAIPGQSGGKYWQIAHVLTDVGRRASCSPWRFWSNCELLLGRSNSSAPDDPWPLLHADDRGWRGVVCGWNHKKKFCSFCLEAPRHSLIQFQFNP